LSQSRWMSESPPGVLPGPSPFVGDHEPPDVVGEASFQAAHGFVAGLPGGNFGVVVDPAPACSHADLGERDDVQRVVELAVSASGQPVACSIATGHLDRGDAGGVGECRRAGDGGQTFTWELAASASGGTTISQVYDWSGCWDAQFKSMMPFIKEEQLAESLAKLGKAAG
jgi:hypothetical protein